jgi:hypothetical protein
MLVHLSAVAVLVCAAPGAAAADRLRDLHLEGWYGKLGLETGVVFARERAAAPLLGATATFVRMNDHLEWFGLQGDVLVDWNGDRDAGARWSLGPEFGVALYGVDVSYFGERAEAGTSHGFQVRAKLTVGVAAVYLRGGFALSGAESSSLETGLQLKLPVFVARQRRANPPRGGSQEAGFTTGKHRGRIGRILRTPG